MGRILAVLAVMWIFTPLCAAQRKPLPNEEMQHDEILTLESETVRAFRQHDPTLFRRIYSDDFVGTNPQGQLMDREKLLARVSSTEVTYDSLQALDIKIRIYGAMGVVTCQWVGKARTKTQRTNVQWRAIRVYVYGAGGFRVVAQQETPMQTQ